MNFEFMPELKQRWGYPIVLIVMAIVTGFTNGSERRMALINIY